jgi:hypothetical protein
MNPAGVFKKNVEVRKQRPPRKQKAQKHPKTRCP